MKRYQNPKQALLFAMIAVSLYVTVDWLRTNGPGAERRNAYSQTVHQALPDHDVLYHSEVMDYESSKALLSAQEESALALSVVSATAAARQFGPPAPEADPTILASIPSYESWKSFSIPEKAPADKGSGRPKIVIIIDDLGMGHDSTLQTIALPGPLTLAFLPYAPQLPEVTAKAREAGHELLIHTPMEPLNGTLNPGPLALRSHMERTDFDVMLEQIFKSFDGYVGINNHMGSKLTRDAEKMEWVMQALEKRGLIFVDSKTIGNSIAIDVARLHGLKTAERDVFLDHEPSREFVLHALEQLEYTARRKGYAVAIGHPKQETLKALQEWLPGLAEKGFDLVPVSAVAKIAPPAVAQMQESVKEPEIKSVDQPVIEGAIVPAGARIRRLVPFGPPAQPPEPAVQALQPAQPPL